MTAPLAADLTAERARRRALLGGAGVYLVTEESLSAGRRSEVIVEAALAGGVRIVQIREKDGSARRALEIARNARELTRRFGALLIVNDRIDVAVACDADGVHLGQTDLPLAEARRLLGEAALLGLSITDAGQMAAPDAADADCLGVGAIFPTASKSDAALTGLRLLGDVRAAVGARTDSADRVEGGTPIVAIGGINAGNAAAAIEAGADLVAVITAITGAADPERAAAELLEVVRAARAGARHAPAGPR
jgi:thiamine-phosphate pyrophosphorylase